MILNSPMSNRIVFFCFMLFFGTSIISMATTYYVCNSGDPACDNTGNGSISKPWCTIAYGISRMNGGDTLYVKSGTYNEELFINGPSGTADKWTVIRAYPGNIVNIDGRDMTKGRVRIANTGYIVFEGFRITNFNYAIFIDSSDNILINNCEAYNVGQEAIHIRKNSHYITIQNSIIRDTRKWRWNGEGIYVGTSSSGPLDNTSHVTIRNNIIYNTNDEGIELKPGTHDCLIEGNLLYNIMINPEFSGNAGAIELNQATINCPKCINGIQTWPSNPNHVVRNNIVHSTKTGIRAGTGSSVYNNIVYNIADPYYGILADNSASDKYPRIIYHNSVDLPADRAIIVNSAEAEVINNIGPSSGKNLPVNRSFFVSLVKGSEDYHLKKNSVPVDAGMVTNVTTDRDGNTRPQGKGFDIGAYEFISAGGIKKKNSR